MVSRDFQSTCLALRSSAVKTGNPANPAFRAAPISGRAGESCAVRITTGLPANMTRVAVAYKWVEPGKGTQWWEYDGGPRWLCRPPLSLSVWWHT
jgi:hypothetical protein